MAFISRRGILEIIGSTALTLSAESFINAEETISANDLRKKLQRKEPFTADDYRSRVENAQKLMAEKNIDALFISGDLNMRYFANVNWWVSERLFGMVINRKKSPIWICPAFELSRTKTIIPTDHEVRTWEEHESPYKLFSGIMKDIGNSKGTLAIDPDTRSFEVFGIRKENQGIEIVDGAYITENCRAIKSEKELSRIELANRITKKAYAYAFGKIKAGMSAGEISSLISEYHQNAGVGGYGSPLFGEGASYPHGKDISRNVLENDLIMVDGGCTIDGYHSDVTRTISYGKISDKQKKIWDVVKKAQKESLNAVRPGVSCGNIDSAARKAVENAGLGSDYEYFQHRLGHGVGLFVHEYPYLVKNNDVKLQTGMVFTTEPGIYFPDEFGIRIEDCFVVTDTGAKVLGGMESIDINTPFGS